MAFTLHLYTSFFALGLGAILLLAHKGNAPHRLMGVIWVLAMASGATSAQLLARYQREQESSTDGDR